MWRNLELCGHGQPLFRGETTQGHVWAVMIVAAYEHYTKKTRLTLRHAIYPAIQLLAVRICLYAERETEGS